MWAYPFDCGDHAVNIPGSGLVDFRVHVVSSQDTQSALISNVNLELAAALKEHKPTTNSALTFMAGNQDLSSKRLAVGVDMLSDGDMPSKGVVGHLIGEQIVYIGCSVSCRGGVRKRGIAASRKQPSM